MQQYAVPAAKLTSDQVAYTAAAPGSLTQAGNQYYVLLGANIAKHRLNEIIDTIDWLVTEILARYDTVRFPRQSGAGIRGVFLKASLVFGAIGVKKTVTLVTSTDMTTHPLTDENAIYVGLTTLAAPPTINYAPAMGPQGVYTAVEQVKEYILSRQKRSTVSSIAVTPASPSISHLAGTVQLVAIATYADGSTEDVSNMCIWVSSVPAKATVNPVGGTPPPGLVTGVAAGTTNVTAAYNGVTSPADVVTVT